jgi:hypothetical protein
MAANAQWAAFIWLLDNDAQINDEKGALAKVLKQDLTNYMEHRFGTSDTTYLVDIINSQAVVDAIVVSLGNVATDAAAIVAAVQTVVTP